MVAFYSGMAYQSDINTFSRMAHDSEHRVEIGITTKALYTNGHELAD